MHQLSIIMKNLPDRVKGERAGLKEAKKHNAFAGTVGAFTMSYMCMECLDSHGKSKMSSEGIKQ